MERPRNTALTARSRTSYVSRPEPTVIELPSGFLVCKPRREGVTVAVLIQEYLKELKEKRAENDRRAA